MFKTSEAKPQFQTTETANGAKIRESRTSYPNGNGNVQARRQEGQTNKGQKTNRGREKNTNDWACGPGSIATVLLSAQETSSTSNGSSLARVFRSPTESHSISTERKKRKLTRMMLKASTYDPPPVRLRQPVGQPAGRPTDLKSDRATKLEESRRASERASEQARQQTGRLATEEANKPAGRPTTTRLGANDHATK